ncbi:hypothetical protein RRG08_058626 [Elysia crispata]|uniref:Uncharacterized protein n=1 Tax=Elysia crispata TaxID=231223 RepID=A0AAE0Z0E4_9GAST|nr:hypothetical protein RRG08_058626 [Elysia crispata]
MESHQWSHRLIHAWIKRCRPDLAGSEFIGLQILNLMALALQLIILNQSIHRESLQVGNSASQQDEPGLIRSKCGQPVGLRLSLIISKYNPRARAGRVAHLGSRGRIGTPDARSVCCPACPATDSVFKLTARDRVTLVKGFRRLSGNMYEIFVLRVRAPLLPVGESGASVSQIVPPDGGSASGQVRSLMPP